VMHGDGDRGDNHHIDMKRQALKKVCAVAALVCAGLAPAFAQSNVTVYGVADVYVQFGKGDHSSKSLESGGLSGSRLGFKGSEDLGDGLRAFFQLESGMAMDTGKTTQGGVFFGRQALVGLSGGFGAFSAGRQYTPHFIALDADDPFETGAGSAVSSGIVTVLASRANNSLVYEAPKLGAVSATLMYAFGESGSGSNNDLISGSLRYSSGPLALGLGFAQQKRDVDGNENASVLALTGSYDFGSVKLMGGVQTARNITRAAATDDDRNEYFAGVQVPVGQGTVWLGGASGKTKNVADSRATQLSAAYVYFLSKRTTLYGVLTAINNGAVTAYTADAATGAGPAVSAGNDVHALQLGIRHRF
jgi:predicted porin